MLERQRQQGRRPSTLGADKNYHTKDMVQSLREQGIAPHIAQHSNRSAPGLDGRTTRHRSYQLSQRKRKLVEEAFGFAKTIAGLRKIRVVGLQPTALTFSIAMAAYNILRIARLTA